MGEKNHTKMKETWVPVECTIIGEIPENYHTFICIV